MKPLVAIRCLVFNHERFLRDCFEGFVMQKTNFRFVVIVHDDCSKDSSAMIIREYTERYPDIFRPIYETENQWSKNDGSLDRIMNEAVEAVDARYVAVCEGDDYWTDPLKLQKQVDFLESHSEYDMVCARFNTKIYETGELIYRDLYDSIISSDIEGIEIKQSHFVLYAQPHPCTVMWRRGTLYDNDIIDKCRFKFDLPLYYCFLYKHRIWLINEKMAMHVSHRDSVTSMGFTAQWNKYLAYVDILKYVPNDKNLVKICAIRYRTDYLLPNSLRDDYNCKVFFKDMHIYISYKPSIRNILSALRRIVQNRIKLNIYH